MTIFFIFIVLHFIFDWIVQSRVIAQNKKKYFSILMKHITKDIVPMLLIMCLILLILGTSFVSILLFFSINLVSHFLIDKYLPSSEEPRKMINLTAIDQILHILFLYISLMLI